MGFADIIDGDRFPALVSLTAGKWSARAAPKVYRRLAKSPHSSRLRELNLWIKLDDAAAEEVWKSPHLEGLELLTGML